MPALIFLFMAGFVIFLLVASAQSRERVNQAWSEVATRLGLEFVPGDLRTRPRLKGVVEGHPLTVDVHSRGAGQHKSVWTRFRLGVPALNLGLELSEENFLSGISRAFGIADIEVGDADFDSRMKILGDDADAVRRFLSPARRARIQQFFLNHHGAIIDDMGITWSKHGRLSKSAQLLATIQEMLVVGESLVPTPQKMVSDTNFPKMVSDTNFSDTNYSEPAGPSIPAVPDVAPATGPGVAEFCDSVFAPGTLSYAAAQTFRERYQGQRVIWTGTLLSAAAYHFDFVFGAGDGIKAIVAIHRVNGAVVGSGEVKAVVQLPAATSGLDALVDRPVRFSGNLIKVDGFQRQVFLTDGRLEP